MKSFALMVVTLLGGFGFLPTLSFASDSWHCDGDNIESVRISETRAGLLGEVQWDCFPGGGICTQRTTVKSASGSNGETIYQGASFKLVIDTAHPGHQGEYRAKITARDRTDESDLGRGLPLREDLTCENR